MLTYPRPGHNNVDIVSRLYPRWRSQQVPLADIVAALAAAELEYLEECQRSNYGYTTRVPKPQGLTSKGMTHLYDAHLRDGHGREYYDDVLEDLNGVYKLCCYCGVRPGDTADHYKEKATFPLLAVFPGNLVPSCPSCNTKLRSVADKFHGYYDSLKDVRWMQAHLIWDGSHNPPGIRYEVITSFSSDDALVGRVLTTFERAQLSKAWSSMVASMVVLAHRHFEVEGDYFERVAFVEDLRFAHANHPEGPFQEAINAMLQSRWLTEFSSRS